MAERSRGEPGDRKPNHGGKKRKLGREFELLSGGHALPPSLVALWQSGTLCDVRVRIPLVTGGYETFEAHRVVLAAGSDFVAALLQRWESTPPNDDYTIDLPDMCPESFKYVLDYLYKGECAVPAEDAAFGTLLQTALRLQVRTLVDAVVAALKKRLCSDNCFAIWCEADRFSQTALATAARDAAAKHFETATRSDDALSKLTAEQMGELLALDRVGVSGEPAIFEALVRWVNLQQPPPAEHVTSRLLRLIRFPTMPAAYYRERVVREPILLQHSEGQRLLLDAFVEGHYGESSPRTVSDVTRAVAHHHTIGVTILMYGAWLITWSETLRRSPVQ